MAIASAGKKRQPKNPKKLSPGLIKLPGIKSLKLKPKIKINNNPKKNPGVLKPAAVKILTMLSVMFPCFFTVKSDTDKEIITIKKSERRAREILTERRSATSKEMDSPLK